MPSERRLEQTVERAAAILRRGGIVAFPTETVYGVGADATNDKAVAKVYALKRRPLNNPLIVHCLTREHAEAFADFDDKAHELAEVFWPGPLTIVLRYRDNSEISQIATAGLPTVGVRCPSHPIAQELLDAADRPIAAPSANMSGRVSTTSANDVRAEFGTRIDEIVDGGPCKIGVESTIVDLSDDRSAKLLRPGGIPKGLIEACLGQELVGHFSSSSGPLRSPGLFEKHYAPLLPMRLNVSHVDRCEALLAFGPIALKSDVQTLNLSPSGNLPEAAFNLYSMMRTLDASGASRIAVTPIPDSGLGETLNDRLRRAASA